jgi:phosphoribosyl 1,2-cyclic phosphate phosphodiesterase
MDNSNKNMSKNKLIVLGTGTSTGIPTIGCHCPVCTSSNPKNRRLRSSVYLESLKGSRIIVDTAPDLREQVLTHKIEELDAVIITHTHADHIHGIDDLRPYCFHSKGKSLPVFTHKESKLELEERFPYIFNYPKDRPVIGGGIPLLTLHEVPLDGSFFSIVKDNFQFFLLPHGYLNSLAFIHEKLGYIIDCKEVTSHTIEAMKKAKLDWLIIDCLRQKPHQTHLHIDAAIQYAQEIGAKNTGLIHFSHHLEHEEMLSTITKEHPSIVPLYDGQTLFYS